MPLRLLRIWTARRLEAAALVGAALGLVEGVRAADGAAGALAALPSLRALLLSIGLAGAVAAAVLPILWSLLGERAPAPAAEAPRPAGRGWRGLALGGVLAAAAGVLVLAALRALLPARGSAPHLLRVALAAGIVLVALAACRRVVEGSIPRSSRRIVLGTVTAGLALGVGLLSARQRVELPSEIDTGSQDAVRPPGWSGAAPPNVLLIVLDTTRADHLSAYGYPRPTSPFLEQLALEATLYENAIAPAPWTLPSHASMFTGLLPRTHQADEEHRVLDSEFTTLAEILLEGGYETVGFSSNSVVGRAYNLQQGFQHYYEIGREMAQPPGDAVEDLVLVRLLRRFVPARTVTDKGSIEVEAYSRLWLDRWQRQADRRPFFAFVNLMEAHLPYRPPEATLARFLAEPISERIRPLASPGFTHGAIYRLIGHQDELQPADYDQLRALYDASLAYQDERMRALVEDLRTRGVLDDTLLIIVGDHGENLGEHGGLLGHAFSVHQTLLHVPLVVRHPGGFAAGLRHPGLVSITSVFATVLEAASLRPDAAWPPVRGPLPRRAEEGAEYVVSEYDVPVFELYNLAQEARGVDIGPMLVRKAAIQDLSWKVVEPSAGTPELYHLATDPGEQAALAPSADPVAAARLLNALHARLAAVPSPVLPPGGDGTAIDRDTKRSLQALGYVN